MNRSFATLLAVVAALTLAICIGPLAQSAEVIPHAQDKPPGPALSPAEAIKRMTVPEGLASGSPACADAARSNPRITAAMRASPGIAPVVQRLVIARLPLRSSRPGLSLFLAVAHYIPPTAPSQDKTRLSGKDATINRFREFSR